MWRPNIVDILLHLSTFFFSQTCWYFLTNSVPGVRGILSHRCSWHTTSRFQDTLAVTPLTTLMPLYTKSFSELENTTKLKKPPKLVQLRSFRISFFQQFFQDSESALYCWKFVLRRQSHQTKGMISINPLKSVASNCTSERVQNCPFLLSGRL